MRQARRQPSRPSAPVRSARTEAPPGGKRDPTRPARAGQTRRLTKTGESARKPHAAQARGAETSRRPAGKVDCEPRRRRRQGGRRCHVDSGNDPEIAAPSQPTARHAPPRCRSTGNRRHLPEVEDNMPTPPSSLDLDRHAVGGAIRPAGLREARHQHNETSPELTGGDVDASWEDAYAVGDEAPGGDNPTPDQDRVDDIGKALGVQYRGQRGAEGGGQDRRARSASLGARPGVGRGLPGARGVARASSLGRPTDAFARRSSARGREAARYRRSRCYCQRPQSHRSRQHQHCLDRSSIDSSGRVDHARRPRPCVERRRAARAIAQRSRSSSAVATSAIAAVAAARARARDRWRAGARALPATRRGRSSRRRRETRRSRCRALPSRRRPRGPASRCCAMSDLAHARLTRDGRGRRVNLGRADRARHVVAVDRDDAVADHEPGAARQRRDRLPRRPDPGPRAAPSTPRARYMAPVSMWR